MPTNHYDVVIIGARCAGASLALRLAGSDLDILLVDRATFPSVPSVPSSPFVHPGTMRLLDELGLLESEYAHPGSRVERFMIHFVGYFDAELPTSRMGLDRNYLYGIDRNRFDHVLWQRAARLPGVTARDSLAVTSVHKDQHGVVTGITARSASGETHTFSADLIVGADGRFSIAARDVGAKLLETQNRFTTAVYHAEWDNVDDYSADYPHAIANYNTGKGFAVLVIPIAERRYLVGTYMRSQDARFGTQGVTQAYLEGLRRVPHLGERMRRAQRVTDVVGVRPIENGYRQAFGANWALVGDAAHYKDPADGQGIYDALLGTKLLAQSILDWKQRGVPWMQAGATYQRRLLDETHTMFEQTVRNVKQALFVNPPAFVIRTLIRYMMSDPDFQTRFLRNLSRESDPSAFRIRPADVLSYVLRGVAADMRRLRVRG